MDGQTDRQIIKVNGANWLCDPENIYIVLDTTIIILCALAQNLWPKTSCCTMATNIMHPKLANMQTAMNLGIDQNLR